MNLQLLDHKEYVHAFPEIIEDSLEVGYQATVCEFNRRGTLIAVGTSDGRIVIFDFETRQHSRILTGHERNGYINSLCWSRDGRKLLSAGNDCNVILWDVLTSTPEKKVAFGSAVTAQLHPKDNNICLVCPMLQGPCLLDLTTEKITELPLLTQVAATSSKKQASFTACFAPGGQKIYVGNAKGVITIIDTNELKVLQSFNAGTSQIKSIQFSKRGKHFLVNSGDRSIRLFHTEANIQEREIQDAVNRLQWKCCCFSAGFIPQSAGSWDSDSDFIVGGSGNDIYIWDRNTGVLTKMLEGPKEAVLHVTWHPFRPIIASCSNAGVVYIWSKNFTENWSAFAPDFEEIEENIHYEEREDEFDVIPDEMISKKKQEDEDDTEVDVVGLDNVPCLADDSDLELEEDIFFLPTEPIKDAPEELSPPTSSRAISSQHRTVTTTARAAAAKTKGAATAKRGGGGGTKRPAAATSKQPRATKPRTTAKQTAFDDDESYEVDITGENNPFAAGYYGMDGDYVPGEGSEDDSQDSDPEWGAAQAASKKRKAPKKQPTTKSRVRPPPKRKAQPATRRPQRNQPTHAPQYHHQQQYNTTDDDNGEEDIGFEDDDYHEEDQHHQHEHHPIQNSNNNSNNNNNNELNDHDHDDDEYGYDNHNHNNYQHSSASYYQSYSNYNYSTSTSSGHSNLQQRRGNNDVDDGYY